jgi:ferric-dicitrate binding protein FerR (iron transport regulator)
MEPSREHLELEAWLQQQADPQLKPACLEELRARVATECNAPHPRLAQGQQNSIKDAVHQALRTQRRHRWLQRLPGALAAAAAIALFLGYMVSQPQHDAPDAIEVVADDTIDEDLTLLAQAQTSELLSLDSELRAIESGTIMLDAYLNTELDESVDPGSAEMEVR